MKTIGLIGGMSWESSAGYYRICNEVVKARLGGAHSAKILMWSADFAEISRLQHADAWDTLTEILCDAARRLVGAGAEMIVICTNTMHMLADDVAQSIGVPLIHIADAAGSAIVGDGHHTVGLLGTAFTMEQPFYTERLNEKHGLAVLVPDAIGRKIVHDVIYNELVKGRVLETARRAYQTEIDKLVARGAQAIILGCTEIGLLIKPTDSPVPVYDTAEIHARAAVEFALA